VKREINLSPEQVKAILGEAKKNSLRDYLLLRTLTVGDFRVGEVVGSAPRVWVPFCGSCEWHWFTKDKCEKCKAKRDKRNGLWISCEQTLPGLLIEDIREDGIIVKGKGWKKEKTNIAPKIVGLPPILLQQLLQFAGTRKTGRIFEISESRVEQMTRFYAKRAGVNDWKLVHPHRFRHYMTTQVARKYGVIAARDIARHANISTTNRYIAEIPDEEKREIIEHQAELISM